MPSSSIDQMGGTVVRTYVLSVKREGSDMGDEVYVGAPANSMKRRFRCSTWYSKQPREGNPHFRAARGSMVVDGWPGRVRQFPRQAARRLLDRRTNSSPITKIQSAMS